MTFGRPPLRSGLQSQGVRSTDVPLELLQNLKMRPLPVTITGTSNRVFTLNASVTRPAAIWNGDDFIYLKSTVAFTWTTSGTQAVIGSDGAETTEGAAAQTIGVYYMYLDEDGQNVLPSQTAPSYVETSLNTGVLGHPGTSRAQNWTYVGFMLCDATTPTFIAMIKTGHDYQMLPQSRNALCCWISSSWNIIIPDLGDQGLTVGGSIEAQAAAAVATQYYAIVGGDADNCCFGVQAVKGTGQSSAVVLSAPFSNLTPADGGEIYSISGPVVSTGTVYVTRITDVV